MGILSVYDPQVVTNFVTNPSLETGTTNWAADNATITRVLDYATHGSWCLKVVTTAGGAQRGCFVGGGGAIAAIPTATYAFSIYVRSTTTAALNLSIVEYDSGNSLLRTNAGTITPATTWTRQNVAATVGADCYFIALYVTEPTTGARTFYVDGAMVELGVTPTTYVDGDQPGCSWTGVAHASTSIRSGQYRGGGVVRDLDTYAGVRTVAVSGLGAMPYQLLDRQYSVLPGNVVDGYRQQPREVTAILTLQGTSLANYHATRKKLSQLFVPGRVYPPTQPIRMLYTGGSVTVQFDGYYQSGLEGTLQGGEKNYEKLAIQFLAADPFVYGTAAQEQTLLASEVVTLNLNSFITNYGTAIAGNPWRTLGTITPTTAKINTAVKYDGGWVIGGLFSNLGGYASADNIAKISNAGSVTALAGGGVDGEVFKIVDAGDPAGRWLVCGAFGTAGTVATTRGVASLDKTAFTYSSLGGGVAGTVYDAVGAPDWLGVQHAYIVGNFTGAPESGPGASTDRIANYNYSTMTWSNVHSGTIGQNGTVTPPYMRCIAVDTNNVYIMVGGQFGTVNSAVGNNLAKRDLYTGTWTAPGTVGPATGLPLSITSTGYDEWVVGGSGITSVGGVTVYNVAQKTAAGWNAMGPGLNDKVNQVKYTWGNLYAAGKFNDGSAYSVGGLGGLAYYDSTWKSIGMTLPAGDLAQSIDISGGYFYVGLNGAGTIQSAAQATVTVNTTAPCYPRVVFPYISGKSGTPTVQSITNETTGQSINLDHTIAVGETFTVDCDYQSNPLTGPSTMRKKLYKTISGVTTDCAGDLQSGSDLATFALVPGENVISVFVSDTSGTAGSAVIAYRPTYDSADV